MLKDTVCQIWNTICQIWMVLVFLSPIFFIFGIMYVSFLVGTDVLGFNISVMKCFSAFLGCILMVFFMVFMGITNGKYLLLLTEKLDWSIIEKPEIIEPEIIEPEKDEKYFDVGQKKINIIV